MNGRGTDRKEGGGGTHEVVRSEGLFRHAGLQSGGRAIHGARSRRAGVRGAASATRAGGEMRSPARGARRGRGRSPRGPPRGPPESRRRQLPPHRTLWRSKFGHKCVTSCNTRNVRLTCLYLLYLSSPSDHVHHARASSLTTQEHSSKGEENHSS